MSATDAKGKAGGGRKINPIKKAETKELLAKYGVKYYKAYMNENEKVEQEILDEIVKNYPNFIVEDVTNRFYYLHKTLFMEQKKEAATKNKSKWEYFAEMKKIFGAIDQPVDLSGSPSNEINGGDSSVVDKEIMQPEINAESKEGKVVETELVQPEIRAEIEKEKLSQPLEVDADETGDKLKESIATETCEHPRVIQLKSDRAEKRAAERDVGTEVPQKVSRIRDKLDDFADQLPKKLTVEKIKSDEHATPQRRSQSAEGNREIVNCLKEIVEIGKKQLEIENARYEVEKKMNETLKKLLQKTEK